MIDLPSREIDEYFMREAIKEATLAIDEGSFPIGCVIVLDGKFEITRGVLEDECKAVFMKGKMVDKLTQSEFF